MREWKVLLNGKLYSDRFDSEELAQAHIEEEVKKGVSDSIDFEVVEMTQEEILAYE